MSGRKIGSCINSESLQKSGRLELELEIKTTAALDKAQGARRDKMKIDDLLSR
jgi:hypothetical protein